MAGTSIWDLVKMGDTFNESDARAFYGALGHTPTDWTEIRVKDPVTDEILLDVCVQGERDFIEIIRPYWDKTVWAGLNPRKDRTGRRNEDVSRRTAVLIDIDYHHKDTPATDAEITETLEKAKTITSKLVVEGHPTPWVDVSGNGVHMILRVDIPIEDSPRSRILAFYATLGINVDEKNADYARMCRVTGTYNADAKRMSRLVNAGDWDNDKVLEGFLKGNQQITDVRTSQTPTLSDAGTDKETAQRIKNIKAFKRKCRPCIRAMIDGTNEKAISDNEHLDHEAHLCIVKEAQYNGLGYAEICALFQQQPDYRKDLTEKYVKAAIEDNALKGIKPWYCNNLQKKPHDWCTSLDPELCDVARWDPAEIKPKTQEEPKDKATELVWLAHESAVEFFRDQYKTPYAVIRSLLRTVTDSTDTTDGILQKSAELMDGGENVKSLQKTVGAVGAVGEDPTQTLAINSKAFKWWLSHLYHEKTGGVIGKEYINSASLLLEAETQSQPVRYLYNRFAPNGPSPTGGIWRMREAAPFT